MELKATIHKKTGDFVLDSSFDLRSPRTGIFGPSGSGKSTLMHVLAGLLTADRGFIGLNNRVLFDDAKRINLKAEHRGIGVVFQHAHLFPHLSVRSNILYGYKRTVPENRKIQPETLYEILGIEELLERDTGSLSGGERQRVALARTVVTCPKLILLDEPLSGLDESYKFQIIPYLKRIFSQFAIPMIFISHSLLELRMMTDEVLVLKNGRIVKHIDTESLARTSWDRGNNGYVNLLQLGRSVPHNDLFGYHWGKTFLILTEHGEQEENLFELDAREILLFKRHPEATSARNLLQCRVTNMFSSGNRVRVELDCSGKTLIAQIVPESVEELRIRPGCSVIAVIKASAFKKIY